MGGKRSHVVHFGPFEADLATGELWRGGNTVPLQQQPFRLLRALIERQGQLVTRAELKRLLWDETTFVAFDRGLISAVRKVRAALGDSADNPRYVETLPGRGYRFIAAVTTAPEVPAPAGERWAAVRWIAAALVIAALCGGAGGRTLSPAARLAAAEALSKYACDLKAQRRFDDALAAIQQAHAMAPESARFTAEVGLFLHAAKRYDEEMAMLRRAVAQDGTSVDAWLHLGLGLARRADFAAAIPALERAAALGPGDPRVRYWIEWAREQRPALTATG